MQLALASKRTPVWPDVACNSRWLDDEKAAAQRGRSGQPKKWMAEDWRGDIEIVPRLPLDGPPSTHRCLVWYYYEEACDMQVSHPAPTSPPLQAVCMLADSATFEGSSLPLPQLRWSSAWDLSGKDKVVLCSASLRRRSASSQVNCVSQA